ncbi:probable tRNA-splicing endonuclease subunit Sen2 [Phalaenopsis equestris]|uniref:probable tRNA-splicing endonuclease subunit Sen2 n=1 Tax=Phalaenopsis equestris TaxID=78828 RepID=UPI0009E23BA7|nr:probable tRNA-splicing endonuclease subunit Sen2 [Phalaenopsis equestris]
MHHDLQALTVITETERPLNELELWNHMKGRKTAFPELYMAYTHLRRKNWVVRSGTQYGVDFVAYRHHPALVHSDYAVIVLQEGDGDVQQNARLRSWSDLQCSLRVSGSVAKTLLVLFVDRNGSDTAVPSCLQQFSVEERTITRWVAEQCREEDCLEKDCKNVVNE